MGTRKILHSDANAFYASVETALDETLKGKAIAVCGSSETRHGIVLAKSEKAKRAGVTTGMANWQAKRLCPDLIIVPPHHEIYAQYSRALHEIYLRYTDLVEPYGLDECWLDVTATRGDAEAIADEIRETVKRELGLTVSVGVSFNKVFAKLGSDLKKPDAVSVISREDFREKVWNLPCSSLLYCGKATTEKLLRFGVKTIGDLARFPREVLRKHFGKNGEMLWNYANGLDEAPVARYDETEQAKSVGHGITCVADLTTPEEVRTVLVALSQELGARLRALSLAANGVSVTVRDSSLRFESWQKKLTEPTQCASVLAEEGARLFCERYAWERKIRGVTLSAISLTSLTAPTQLSLFAEEKQEKRRKAEEALDQIRARFGEGSIRPAVLFTDTKMPEQSASPAHLPGKMKSKK